jgi:anti-sigma B factor antagonist
MMDGGTSALLAVDVVDSADGPVLKLVGELDLSTVGTMVDLGRRALAGSPTLLTVDLAGVEFCDSAGINGLVKLRNASVEQDSRFRVANPRPHVRRVLADLTGLGEFLGIEAESG